MSYIYTHTCAYLSEGCWQHLDVADFGNRCTQDKWNNMSVQRNLRLPYAASKLPCWRDACRKLSTWAHLPCTHVLGCPPCAPGQRQKQLALPQDQAVSDTRPRAGGLNYSKIVVGGGEGAGSQQQAPVQRADGYLVRLGEGAPSPTTCLSCMPL